MRGKVRISSTSGRNFFGTIDRIAENVVEGVHHGGDGFRYGTALPDLPV